MKILNLVYPEKSDIKYKIQRFPDGQQNVILDEDIRLTRFNPISKEDELVSLDCVGKNIKSVQITSRFNNFLDLEIIICAAASLRELGVEEIHLYTPFVIGARSDRKFDPDKDGYVGNNYIKDVLAPIINSLNFKTVTCIDPHSDVLEACVKNFKKKSNLELIHFAITDMYKVDEKENYILISPDTGASKKIYKLAEKIGYKGDVIICSKDRDENGKLTKTVVPYSDKTICTDKDYIILDDICDGGATFINIAKVIKNHFNHEDFDGYQPKIYLIVTHGIFSKDFKELSKYFDGIYCTNSYQDLGVQVGYRIGTDWTDLPNFIKQLNVF